MPLFEPSVTVVNRVRDKDGKPVPWTAYYGGESFTIVDKVSMPLGAARVVIHHSMYKLEPDTMFGSYRLGCEELGLPTDPLTQDEVGRIELIDRELLGADRQFGAKDRFGRKLTPVRKQYRAMRHDSLIAANPGSGDGAYAGEVGEPRKPS